MKPLLLGESPSPAAGLDGWRAPLSGRVCTTLCQLAGLEPVTYGTLQNHFDLENVVTTAAQASELSDSWWTSLDARTRFEQIWEASFCSVVVCLGRRVTQSAGLYHVRWGDWTQRRTHMGAYRPIVAIPHPSGLNRMYNDAETCASASAVLKEAIGSCES